MSTTITAKELHEQQDKDNLVLLDVRREADRGQSDCQLPGAVWRNPEKIEKWIEELEPDSQVVVYCVRGGSVSKSTIQTLNSKGINACYLEGGIEGWQQQGLAVTAKKDEEYRLKESDLALLRQAGMSEDDLDHSLRVAWKALEIAGRLKGVPVDQELVGRGALFHDLGKSQTHAIEHGRLGAELGKKLGLPEEITIIMEKHIRGGLTAGEARELGLPEKDYTLDRLEERIIIYADRLVDIITEDLVEIDDEREAEDRFEEILKSHIKYGKNDLTTQRYLGYHSELQGLMK